MSNSSTIMHVQSTTTSPAFTLVETSIVSKPSLDSGSVVIDMDEHTEVTEYESTSQTSSSSSSGSGSSSSLEEHGTVHEDERSVTTPPGTTQTHLPLELQRTSSILKRRSEPLHIRETRASWKCLPKPDMKLVRSNSRSWTEREEDSQHFNRTSSVAFGLVTIRSYAQTLGDNSSVSYGPPISLDWDYEENDPLTIDNYEDNRAPRRSMRQMVLSYYTRKNILTWQYGVTEADLKAAKTQVKREQLQRNITATLLPVMRIEDALESAKRKARRVFGKKKTASN